MKNGFTLVELLAVIIILTLIMAIVSPIVLKTVKNSRTSINNYSAAKYIDAVEQAVLEKNLNEKFKPYECTVNTDGNLNCEGTILEIDADGKKPVGGEIRFNSRDVTTASLKYGDKTIVMHYNGKFIPLEEPVSFAQDSWDTIAANVIAGNLSKYNVGDTKEIELTGFTNGETGSNGLYTARIANISTPEECKTKGYSQTACGFVIEFVDIIAKHNMNPAGEYKGTQYDYGWNVDGYSASPMHTYIQNDIYNALPKELKSVIILTIVVSSHGSTSGETNFISEDKVYLLSTKEVWGKEGTSNIINYDTAETETRQLDYYKSIGVTTNNYSGAIKKYNGSANIWWLRSASSGNTHGFYYVSSSGNWLYNHASPTYGVAVAFRIG